MSQMLGKASLSHRIRTERLLRAWCGGLSAPGETSEPDSRTSTACDLSQASTTFGHYYDCGSPITHGWFGVVVRAVHKVSQKDYMIKIIGKSTAGCGYREHVVDGGVWDCLLRMTIHIPHQNILKFFDLLESKHHYLAAMEPLHGLGLAEQVEHIPMTESYGQRVLRQVLAGLAHLHNRVGIVHRDVKLENFRFRTRSGDSDLVLVDFGHPRFIGDEIDWNEGSPGTALYLAPEVVRARDCEARTTCMPCIDMWAAGVMLYIILARASPWDEADVLTARSGETVDRLLAGAFSFLEHKALTNEVVELLKNLLAPDINKRMSADQAAEHPWFAKIGDCVQKQLSPWCRCRSSSSDSLMTEQSSFSDRTPTNTPRKSIARKNSLCLEALARVHVKFCWVWDESPKAREM